MKEKINTIINRKDWSFNDFLKKYWWIEFIALVKILNKFDDWIVNISVILGILIFLWVLYRIGLK
ncbi:hypothetical protein KKG24_00415 [Patescibacteria group bacterium]|nr:hypothetical protein [Patescibacteria group bacterium]